jgi:hypothetical protein
VLEPKPWNSSVPRAAKQYCLELIHIYFFKYTMNKGLKMSFCCSPPLSGTFAKIQLKLNQELSCSNDQDCTYKSLYYQWMWERELKYSTGLILFTVVVAYMWYVKYVIFNNTQCIKNDTYQISKKISILNITGLLSP